MRVTLIAAMAMAAIAMAVVLLIYAVSSQRRTNDAGRSS
jgi:hypothetical protein